VAGTPERHRRAASPGGRVALGARHRPVARPALP
jgi:hypothetical protein